MKDNTDEKNELQLFKGIYLTYAIPLILYACKFVDRTTAEDLVQDMFLKMWQKKAFRFITESVKSYLYTAVQHACLDYLKHLDVKEDYVQSTMLRLKIEELYFHDNPDFLFSADERLVNVLREIDKLPEKCKEIFQMYYMEERKSEEIASLLDISKRTVEAQLYKALKYLRAACRILLVLINFW